MTHLTTVVIVIALSGTACSAGDSSDTAAPESTATVTATATVTVTASPESAASPSPTAAEPNVDENALQIGEWREGVGLRTRVMEVRQAAKSTRPSYLQDDTTSSGAVVLVRSCARDTNTDPAVVSGFNWSGTSNGALFDTSGSSWDEWPPRPQYPLSDYSLRPGKCVEGWILLSVPDGTKVDTVTLGDGSGGAAAEWLVK